jgi:hypothetical protein
VAPQPLLTLVSQAWKSRQVNGAHPAHDGALIVSKGSPHRSP